MSSIQEKETKDKPLLTSMAESIGSTLGTIVAKASAVPDALSHSGVFRTAEREGKKFITKGKKAERKITKTVSKRAKSRQSAKTIRRGSQKSWDSGHASGKKRVVRRARPKK